MKSASQFEIDHHVYTVTKQNSGSGIAFSVGGRFSKSMSDQSLLESGLTVAEDHEKAMHDKLQSWIDSNKGVVRIAIKKKKSYFEEIFVAIGVGILLGVIAWTYYQRDRCLEKGGVYIVSQQTCIKAETL